MIIETPIYVIKANNVRPVVAFTVKEEAERCLARIQAKARRVTYTIEVINILN